MIVSIDGKAPGSWSQVLSRELYSKSESNKVKIVAVDLQKMAPLEGVIQIEGDISDKQVFNHSKQLNFSKNFDFKII